MEALEELVTVMEAKSYQGGEVLFKKGDAGDEMYFILSGRIRIFLPDEQGNELTFRYYGEGQVVGDFALLDGQPRSASAAAAGPLNALALNRHDFWAFLEARLSVGLAMMRSLTERIRYTQTYLERVMQAVESLAGGDYERVLQEFSASDADEEIEGLIAAFLQMVRSVKARQAALEQELEGALSPPTD